MPNIMYALLILACICSLKDNFSVRNIPGVHQTNPIQYHDIHFMSSFQWYHVIIIIITNGMGISV